MQRKRDRAWTRPEFGSLARQTRLDTAFYPPVAPARTATLPVDGIHTLYWEEFGARGGPPIVILHGGPGGGIRDYYRQLADPDHYRVILFEQRGCCRSTPVGELKDNTTSHLIEDMEQLRKHLDIGQWLVLGGSWGSTLALAYAQAHPESCSGVIVTGVTLARSMDTWWWWEGVRFVYPEVWQAFRDFLPPEERAAMRENYVKRVLHADPRIHEPAAVAMMCYEAQTLDVWPDANFIGSISADPQTLTMARIFAHYENHRFFLNEGQLVENAPRLRGIPGFIINGRFDMCTPPRAAYDLHRAWPDARLRIVPAAGHRWNDPLLGNAVIGATDWFRDAGWG